MSAVLVKLFFFALFIVETSVFGIVPLLYVDRIPDFCRGSILGISNAFAGGVFLGSGFIHMLGESLAAIHEVFQINYPIGALLAALGFLFTFLFEKSLLHKQHHPPSEEDRNMSIPLEIKTTRQEEPSNEKESQIENPESDNSYIHVSTSYILVIVLSLHSILSGFALGVQGTSTEVWPIGLAIIAHKWVEVFAIAASLVKLKTPLKRSLSLIGLYGVMEPAGVLLGLFILVIISEKYMTYLQCTATAVASGTFIYVASVDILVEEFSHGSHFVLKSLACLVGFFAMAALALLEM